MDERLRYEQLIGGKLQSLPVPDMQDAIWARIKTQLDLDMPADDGDDGSSPQSPTGPKIIGWGLSVVIVALIATFFTLKNNPEIKQHNNDTDTTTEQVPSPSVQNNSPPLRKSNSTNNTKNNTVTKRVSRDVVGDSTVQKTQVNNTPFADDSVRASIAQPSTTTSSPGIVDTSLKVKKGKGMKGLNDSDYRIVPKN